MRVIVHTAEPEGMMMAMRCVRTCIREGYKECGFREGSSGAFVKLNKTGWTVYVIETPIDAGRG